MKMSIIHGTVTKEDYQYNSMIHDAKIISIFNGMHKSLLYNANFSDIK